MTAVATADAPRAIDRLKEEKIPFLLCGYSSLDRYFRVGTGGPLYLATDASLVSLAKAFDDLQFPGLPLEDAAVQDGAHRLVFRCVDSLAVPPAAPFRVLRLLYDQERNTFIDRLDVYPELRAPGLDGSDDGSPSWLALCEAARLVSRYHYTADASHFAWGRGDQLPPAAYQRDLLAGLMGSPSPDKGLALLAEAGFVQEAWPELSDMAGVPHGKDFHPEGNVWEHTLATLTHRKRPDLLLSLALLLHDSGKPFAQSVGDKRFDGHAEIGARIAVKLLRRLGFPAETVSSVEFLVRYHMMPPALKILPPFRTDPIFASPLFPLLLELYRADAASSYAGDEGYYEACRLYKAWQKDRGNPFLVEKRRRQRARMRR
ncbi:MAG TPA: HD domain-containing protein [Spirochaetia bacterium]|nr:HD domain-containing protein [Spirochaetia bacterium]